MSNQDLLSSELEEGRKRVVTWMKKNKMSKDIITEVDGDVLQFSVIAG